MKFYRPLISLLLLMQLVTYFFPWGVAYPGYTVYALDWLGENSIANKDVIIFISIIITSIYAITYIGLFFYCRWARILLVLVSLLGGFAIALYGISVQSSFEGMFGYFATLGDGVVIALSFFSDVKRKFLKIKS